MLKLKTYSVAKITVWRDEGDPWLVRITNLGGSRSPGRWF